MRSERKGRGILNSRQSAGEGTNATLQAKESKKKVVSEC